MTMTKSQRTRLRRKLKKVIEDTVEFHKNKFYRELFEPRHIRQTVKEWQEWSEKNIPKHEAIMAKSALLSQNYAISRVLEEMVREQPKFRKYAVRIGRLISNGIEQAIKP